METLSTRQPMYILRTVLEKILPTDPQIAIVVEFPKSTVPPPPRSAIQREKSSDVSKKPEFVVGTFLGGTIMYVVHQNKKEAKQDGARTSTTRKSARNLGTSSLC